MTFYDKQEISKDKIIVAIEIENLFVKVSSRYQKGYLPIRYKKDYEKTIFEKGLEKLGFGHYYKPLYSNNKIKDFLNQLTKN